MVPAWTVVVIIAREFAVTSLRSFAAAESLVIPAGVSGKIKTIVQIVSIALLIIYNQLGEFRHLAPFSLWAALAITIYSGVEYFVRFGRLILLGEAPRIPLPLRETIDETIAAPAPRALREAPLPVGLRRHSACWSASRSRSPRPAVASTPTC